MEGNALQGPVEVQVQMRVQVLVLVQILGWVQVEGRYLYKTKMCDWEVVLGCAAMALWESAGSFDPLTA